MSHTKSLEEFLERVTGRKITQTELAETLDISRRTWLNRRMRLGRPESDDIIALARHYWCNPVAALMYCGAIKP
ncbi:hypothetical protein [Gordonia sp. C13]|uniref:hypothetical protein n=1 Tax=Gordonia sp. C13 TaxID=2935078 RepID=UPI00200B89FA|nr:hypothetical protein [Gordonia sp. C13]MCK8616206.1 hypothetical protein [Gordonia sp. C13]